MTNYTTEPAVVLWEGSKLKMNINNAVFGRKTPSFGHDSGATAVRDLGHTQRRAIGLVDDFTYP